MYPLFILQHYWSPMYSLLSMQHYWPHTVRVCYITHLTASSVFIFIISVWLCSVMMDYSCNYTSREWSDVIGKNSDVSAQFRALFSEVWSRVQGRVTLYMQKAGKRTTSGGNDGGAARKVMCDKRACTKLGWVSTEQVTMYQKWNHPAQNSQIVILPNLLSSPHVLCTCSTSCCSNWKLQQH